MEVLPTEQDNQTAVNELYSYAADLLIRQQRTNTDVIQLLVQRGISENAATIVVDNLESQLNDAKKAAAKKDMLYGALWCVGGTVATMAHIGFIFWGAIVFGGIQFFKGLINL
jgi:hypothetical protein